MEKHSGSWYRVANEVTAVVNLQKSQYGPSYYINVGFWISAVEPARFPRSEQCHVSFRIERLMGDDADRVARLLNLDTPVDEDRSDGIRTVLTDRLAPVLIAAQTLLGLRDLRQ